MVTALLSLALEVSIHAPHEGERRQKITGYKNVDRLFQSTLPTRGSDSELCLIRV